MKIPVRSVGLQIQPVIFIGVIVFLSLFFGISAAILPPLVLIALIFLPLLILVTWTYPALALLILIAVLYGVIPPSLVPNIPLGGGKLQANDLALACLFVVVVLRSTKAWPEIISRIKPLRIPLGLLFFLFLFSLIFSFGYFHTPTKHVFAEIRNFLYWLLLPTVVAIVALDRSRYYFILNGIVVIGYIISFALLFQHLTGIDVLGSGRVEQLVTLDKTSDVIRTTSPGIYLIVLSIYLILARWLSGQMSPVLAGLACAPLLLGVLVTFGRGVWLASATCLVLLAASIGRKAFLRLILVGGLALPMFSIGLMTLKPETGQAIFDRVFSVAKEVQSGSSVEWRYLENKYAIDHLMSNPIVGVGIGGFAHPKFHPMMDDDLLRYVHNGYLYLAVKIGVLGLLVPIIIILSVAKWLREQEGGYSNSVSASRKAILAIFFVPCITSFTQPEWMVYTGVGFLALTLGLILSAPTLEAERK